MPNFTTSDVKKLRNLTGAGMLDCKNALTETDGDFDKAVEILRIKGAKDVGKRSDRTAGNGLVAAAEGALIELNCETDFVAKNEQFQRLGAEIAAHVARTTPSDLPELLSSELAGHGSVQDYIASVAATVGEKIALRRFVVMDGEIATYLHKRDPDLPPQVGVLVSFTGLDIDTARAAAMQVAAMRPKYVSRDEVPEDAVAAERRIAEESARTEGKPDKAIPKIIEGKVAAFFRDTVLVEQTSVLDNKKTVGAVLDEAGISIRAFARFEVGQA